MAPLTGKISSVCTSKNVPCSSQLHSTQWHLGNHRYLDHSMFLYVLWVLFNTSKVPGPHWAPQLKKKKTLQPEVRWTVAELVFNRKLVHTGDTLFSSICPHLQQGATTIVQWACTVILITCHKALGGLCPHDPLDSRSISGLTHVGESHTLLLPSSKSPLSFLLSSSLCFFLHPVPWILCHLHYSMLCKY